MQYVISRHARQRFVNRFRIYFHHSYFMSDQFTESLMESLLNSAERVDWWRQVPFYRNKVESKYGPTTVLRNSNKGITFICTPLNEGVTIVRTVVKDFDPRY